VFPVDGESRRFCCAGCEAAAAAIAGAGLEDYYRLRAASAARPAVDAEPAAYEAYDDPAFQAPFVTTAPNGVREAALLLDGVRCSACVWLNEQVIRRLPGVETVAINYATRRVQVRWDPARLRLSEILAAVTRVGYRAFPYDRGRVDALYMAERRAALWRLFVAAFGMMQVMMYAIPTYIAGADDGMPRDVETLMRWASLCLTAPVVLYSARPFFAGAWRDLHLHRAGMDVPVALGIAVAFLASVWGTLRGTGEVYFDSITMFVFLLLGGRYLEFEARHRAGATLDYLARMVPAVADRLTAFPGPLEPERVVVSALRPGDFVLVRPGERVPADGEVVEGAGAVNEALLTGESRPQAKRPGQRVIGGSINLADALVVRVERVGGDTMLAAIVRLVERAMSERHRLVALADRYAHWFILAVLVISAATGLAWAVVDPSRAVWITVSVLVVTCPCALSLATPVALTVATGELARRGLVVTRGHAVETLARATDVVLDKTGTLTHGELRVAVAAALGAAAMPRCRSIARALEAASEHPIARAILREAEASGSEPAVATGLRNYPGRGVEGAIDGTRYRLGTRDFCAEFAGLLETVGVEARGAATEVFLVASGEWLARFELADTLKPGAAVLVRALEAMGKRVHLLSGDGANAVEATAAQLGIGQAVAGADPAAKQAYVAALQRSGAVVAMVGDGINDAPVLAQADVSVALATGADLAQAQADAVLLSGDPAALAAAMGLAQRAMAVVRQNLAWASAYNLVAIPAAALGYVTPWIAGVGMSSSSLAVVLNALRLRSPTGRDTGAEHDA
jgi:Cu2+-exporting ATPase